MVVTSRSQARIVLQIHAVCMQYTFDKVLAINEWCLQASISSGNCYFCGCSVLYKHFTLILGIASLTHLRS